MTPKEQYEQDVRDEIRLIKERFSAVAIGIFIGSIIAALLVMLSGCKQIQYVPLETVKTETVHKTDTVSITKHDSVYVHEKGDTVFVEKYRYIDRWRTKDNQVIKVDSIPYPVEVIKTTNVLTKWQQWQIRSFWILLAVIAAIVALKVYGGKWITLITNLFGKIFK